MGVDGATKINTKIMKIVFFCVFCFSLLIGILFTLRVKNAEGANEDAIEYIDNWTVIDEEGNSFETGRSFDDKRAYSESFTCISKLPDDIKDGKFLCFMNASSVKVYINDELRKEFDIVKDIAIPSGFLKEFYIQVPLSADDSGATIKIEKGPADRNPMVVPKTFISTPHGIYSYMVNKYGIVFCLSLILFIASLLAVLIAIIMSIWMHQTIDMLYGAIGILVVACWLIAVSQLTPFITGIYYVDGFMGFMFCMMMPFALMIYFNSIQKNRYKIVHIVLFVLTFVSMAFWTTLHFLGIQSLLKSLLYIDLVLAIVIIGFLVTLIIDIKKGLVKEYCYTAKGFFIFMIMAIVEIVKIIFMENWINEIPMLIGLFGLLVMVVLQQVDDVKKSKEVLEKEIQRKKEEKEQMLIHIVETLAGTIDAKDTYTKGHSSRVADYAREIAKRAGYDENALNDIYMMGLLHDIGKIGVPDAIINKTGKLTFEEYEIIKEHPVIGANILKKIKEKTGMDVGARWHHERFGGGGYPDGLKGNDIPEQARIIAVADAYDAMTSWRSYRDPMPQQKVKEEIEEGMGTQFDPKFAKIMLEMIEEDKNYDMREKGEN